MRYSRLDSVVGIISLVLLFVNSSAFGQEEKNWHCTVGTRVGGYALESFDIDFDTSYSIAPIIDFWYKNYGVGFSFLYTQLKGILSTPEGTYNEEAERYDIDLSLKYKINQYFMIVSGARFENNETKLEGDREAHGYTVMMGPVIGAACLYPSDSGFTPYFIAAAFPYAGLDAGAGLEATGWGGAGDLGISYNFIFDLSLCLGVKYQYLTFDLGDDFGVEDSDETIWFYYGGVFYAF